MEEIYSFSVLHIMNRNSSDSRDVYLHHQYRFIYLYICISISIISITRAITWCWWCELCCPSWWITQTDRRGGRTTGDGTTPKTPLGHWGVLWGSLQSIKHSLWNNEGPGARGRARGCSGLIWRPKGAHSGLSLPDVHLQLPTSIFLCYSHQNLNWYHLKSAHFFYTTAELCSKVFSTLNLNMSAPAALALLYCYVQSHIKSLHNLGSVYLGYRSRLLELSTNLFVYFKMTAWSHSTSMAHIITWVCYYRQSF